MLWALPLFLTALVVKADPLPIRPPVVGYAGLLSPMRQAVLLDPKHVLDEAVKQREEPALSTTPPSSTGVTPSGNVNTPTASALFQASRSVRPILFSRSGNGTRKRIRRIRPRLQGLRRKTGSAALLSSAGVRTAVSQAAGLARRRSGVKVGQYGGPPRWGNSQGILQTRTAQQGVPVPIKEAENKSSVDDFLTRWRKIYSKGHTTTPVSTAGHHQAWNEDEIAKKPKPSATTSLPRHRERTSNSDTNRFNPSQIMEAKHPFAPVAHLSKMPSVHELTSFHFSDSNALSQALDNSDVMQKLQSSTTTTEAPTTTTPTTTSVMLLTSPRTQRPFENVAQEREILESIQSIFQTVDRDGQQAPANEVESPPSFDIFAGSEATQGFRPSFRLRPEVEVQNSYSVYEEQADKQVPSYGTSNLGSWETNDAYTTPDNTLAHNAGPTVLVSTPPPGSDLTLHVGHSLPVMNDSPAMAEQRQTESFNGNIIIGRPAALIQPPTDTPERIVDAPALPHYREEPMYIHNPPTAPTQPSILFSPRPIWEPEELGPLLQYIESTYDPKLSQNSQHSVSHLQSMIKSGQAPNVFVNDQLVDYIRNRPHLQLPPGLSRFGQPPRQSIERASVDALDNGGLRTGSAFVALSGIALAFVLGAYFLFTGSVDQARGSQDPIRARVEDAKKGLRLLMKGLDEYEQYLDTDKTEEDEREEPIESDTSYDIPVILNKIWDNLSSTVNHILEYESHFNNGARTPVSSEDNSSGETYFRKPHVMSIFPDPEDSEISLGSSGNLINTNEGKDSSSLSGSNLNSSIKGSPAGNQSIFDIIAQLRQEYLVQKEKEKKMKTTTELSITTTDDSLTNEPETYTPRHEAEEHENDQSKERYTEITYDDTNFTEQTMLSTTWENEVTEENRVTEDEYPTDADDLISSLQQENGQENTGLDTTTLTLEGRPTPTTTTTPSSLAKKVIINNHLHVYHNPETDPPRSSAFLNNVPFRRLT